jgi:hypothetical protein
MSWMFKSLQYFGFARTPFEHLALNLASSISPAEFLRSSYVSTTYLQNSFQALVRILWHFFCWSGSKQLDKYISIY